jgi:hypothetical protein
VRPGAALFGTVVAAAGAAFAVAILPSLREAESAAARIESADPAAASAEARRWGGPSQAEVRRAADTEAALRPPPSPAARPPGLREEEPGSFRGRVRWTDMQDLFAWVASSGRPLESMEIRAREDDPDRAECRVILVAEERK